MKSFCDWDIYYLYEYAYSFMLHGDGDILLIYFEYERERFCYVVMQSDIADCESFAGGLEKGRFYDWETPYGYGGPLTDTPISHDAQRCFLKELSEYCSGNNIVSQFVRFHPLLRNYGGLEELFELRCLRDTIFIDTSDRDVILQNMDSKNRNMVRKAIKNGVSIVRTDISDIDSFISMYNETMLKNGAGEYYTFGQEYFDYLRNMQDNICIFYAVYQDRRISGAIIYYNDRYMHYHLSGSRTAFRQYAAGNLLLYEAACQAADSGIRKFHLGGGMRPDDSLFGFKKQFNRQGRSPFVVGRTIFDKEAYENLLQIRCSIDAGFDKNNDFMIQYRR